MPVEAGAVTLSAAGSFDPDDSIASYFWNQTDGPAATLTNANSSDVSFTAPLVDTDGVALTFELTVRDSNGFEDFDSCVIYVNNAADGDGDLDAFVANHNFQENRSEERRAGKECRSRRSPYH